MPRLIQKADSQPQRWLIVLIAVLVMASDVRPSGTEQLAYIGPGAGIALIGSFLVVLSALASAFLVALTWPIRAIWRAIRGRKAMRNAKVKRVVILGLDGLEPTLTEQYIEQGLLPNMAKLKEQGSYRRLGTTCPPLSPVAWSSFSTGTNPGRHNIFDFISRNPATYKPTISSVQTRDSTKTFRIGKWIFPLSRSRTIALRKSKPFWTVLGESGVFSAVLRVPITYPPDKFRGVQLSAMCVPDLRGTHGTFSFFTEEGAEGHTTDGDVGGERIHVSRKGDAIHGELLGPKNTMHADAPDLHVPFTIQKHTNGTFLMTTGGQRITLKEGEYSDWVRVAFPVIGRMLKIHGICRFLIKSFDAPFAMYCTAMQIDPDKPAANISHPRVYSCYLARLLGSFSTLGLAEDTWSLSEGVITDDDFLAQAYDIHAERENMFFDALQHVRKGLVVCVFDGPDRIQHMFWRYIDKHHPARNGSVPESRANTIRDMYAKMDALVGKTIETIDDDTALFVMSDHGFKSFRRGVDLNAWLLANGYLFLKDDKTFSNTTYLNDVDWTRTRAYAIGLAGIFINRKGREGKGIIEPEVEYDALVRDLCEELTGLRDEEHNAVAIHEAMARGDVYNGPYVDAAPDVIMGYNEGYRVSWESAIGKCSPRVFLDNTKAWSGDHCIHPSLVPGILFSNRKLKGDNASIIDMAPTTLDLFGVKKPAYMEGSPLL